MSDSLLQSCQRWGWELCNPSPKSSVAKELRQITQKPGSDSTCVSNLIYQARQDISSLFLEGADVLPNMRKCP